MPEMVLPGVFIEERPEALIVPGPITLGNIGIVGTAASGPLGEVRSLGSYSEARAVFGDYDAFQDGKHNELTLVRALKLAYDNGASNVFATRITGTVAAGAPNATFVSSWNAYTNAVSATFNLPGEAAGSVAAVLQAVSPGTAGNLVSVNVWDADDDTVIANESHAGPAPVKLSRSPIAEDPRNQVLVWTAATGQSKSFDIVYAPAAAAAGKVQIDKTNGNLTFVAADAPAAGDKVTATYVVPKANSRKVTIAVPAITEQYAVVDGNHLVELISRPGNESALVTAKAGAGTLPTERPKKFNAVDEFRNLSKGTNGEAATPDDYGLGLALLTTQNVHIVVAAGRDDSSDATNGIGTLLTSHVETASTDKIQRDRIAVLGSRPGASLAQIAAHRLANGRVVFVGPGVQMGDAVLKKTVTLPGSYAAAAVAGMISARDPHVSLTNKTVNVDSLEVAYTPDKLEQLVQARVLALEDHQGIRVVRGITTDPGPFQQITTRRIVDYAKYGVRASAEPFIGLLNNERVRKALKGSINGFLVRMVDDEMLEKYDLDVSATRAEEIAGIARVTITLLPTFSIDYIVVTMFLS